MMVSGFGFRGYPLARGLFEGRVDLESRLLCLAHLPPVRQASVIPLSSVPV